MRKIIPMGDRARATVKVRVEIIDADERLFPDMSSTVYFLANEAEDSTKQGERRVFCPSDAVVTSDSESWVWLLTDSNRTKKKVISVGESRDGRTEILSGLSGGEKVVAGPPAELKNDELVKPSL